MHQASPVAGGTEKQETETMPNELLPEWMSAARSADCRRPPARAEQGSAQRSRARELGPSAQSDAFPSARVVDCSGLEQTKRAPAVLP